MAMNRGQLPAGCRQRPPSDRGGGGEQPAAGRGTPGADAGAHRDQRRCPTGCDDAGCGLLEQRQPLPPKRGPMPKDADAKS